jgi:hypothetical protein
LRTTRVSQKIRCEAPSKNHIHMDKYTSGLALLVMNLGVKELITFHNHKSRCNS